MADVKQVSVTKCDGCHRGRVEGALGLQSGEPNSPRARKVSRRDDV